MAEEIEEPRTEIYDLGVVNLGINSGVTNSFSMPFSGYVRKCEVSWPSGANNAIGMRLSIGGKVVIPKNYPDVEYVADDDAYVPFYIIRKVREGTGVMARIYNDSDNNKLDLQVRVTVANFNPVTIRPGVR